MPTEWQPAGAAAAAATPAASNEPALVPGADVGWGQHPEPVDAGGHVDWPEPPELPEAGTWPEPPEGWLVDPGAVWAPGPTPEG
jgi:hypothetical protein